MSVEKLASILVKDKAYFGAEGGVTLSGGEVMLQHEAALALARRLKAAGINVAIDTAGCFDFRLLEAMLPCIDLVLYDLKIYDGEEHRKFTGADNSLILENFRRLLEHNARVWVRTPIIEGATDSEENIAAIGSFIEAAEYKTKAHIEKWELCAFNRLCRDKYERLELEWAYKDTGPTVRSHIEKLTEIANRYIPGTEYTGTVTDDYIPDTGLKDSELYLARRDNGGIQTRI